MTSAIVPHIISRDYGDLLGFSSLAFVINTFVHFLAVGFVSNALSLADTEPVQSI